MAAVTWLGFGAFFVVAWVVGIRLLLLARRSGELPELLVGIGVLGIGPVGFGLSVIGQHLVGGGLAPAVRATALLAVGAGTVAQFTFIWRVYHPQSRLTMGIVGVTALVTLLCFAASVSSGSTGMQDVTLANATRSWLLIACLLWGSAEAIRYWRMMQRRKALGLADPVVTARFLLWGIAAAAAGIGAAISNFATFMLRVAPDTLWVMMNSSLFGLIAAIGMWLAFLPPPRYLAHVRGEASSAASSH